MEELYYEESPSDQDDIHILWDGWKHLRLSLWGFLNHKLNYRISSIPSPITGRFYKMFNFYYFYGTQNRKMQSTALES